MIHSMSRMRSTSILALILTVAHLLMAGCASTAAGAGPRANVSLAGRWSGSFLSSQGGGGTARLVIDDAGRVRGSISDSAGTHAGEATRPRVGAVEGSLESGQMKLAITWSAGEVQRCSGKWSNQGRGSLGANLDCEGGGEIVLALHEQGVPGRPPYGQPARMVQPDFQRQWIGTWTVNWFDGGADYGSGTVTIAADGTLDGALVDDAFNTTEWNQPVGATIKGKVGKDGSMTAGIAWSTGRPGWGVEGKAHFTGPESFQIQFTPTGSGDPAERSITMTFHR